MHVQSDQPTAALAAYRSCKQTLERELGISPSAATTALMATLPKDPLRLDLTPSRPRQSSPGRSR
ncbi:BTAD domain-containing putative transcriptional regulator [Deinococcus malanensis]|uniref:BTAD domain-containing putative transcriptional regulator n=1 Tax=Deinococcus malanensis TaxID=1706855 RepID=UPI003635227F